MPDEFREPFNGRYFGIISVEGDDPMPLCLFRDEAAARTELKRRQALDSEADDHLNEYHDVFPTDVLGVWWNSYEPDPRRSSPLSREEITRLCT